MPLTHGYLCMGTFLSAQQAWHLLHDANLLYGQKRYANSLVLSVYSVEEVGRSHMYLESTEEVLQGKVITLENLRKLCKDHMKKLSQGRIESFYDPYRTAVGGRAACSGATPEFRKLAVDRTTPKAYTISCVYVHRVVRFLIASARFTSMTKNMPRCRNI